MRSGIRSRQELCERYGISRKTGWKWCRRYEQEGLEGLKDKPRGPRAASTAWARRWQKALLEARRRHPDWGPKKLRWLLQKRGGRVPALRSLARWLKAANKGGVQARRAKAGPRLKWSKLRDSQRPNEVWTVDFKGWFRTLDGERIEPLTVRDLFSRYVLGVNFVKTQSEAAVRQAMRRIFMRHGLPAVIRVDNGVPWSGKGALNLTRLSVWWLRLGIEVEFIARGRPQENGAHEQMHRVYKAQCANPPARNRRAQARRTRQWIEEYNHRRPHEALGQRPPASCYVPSRRRLPKRIEALGYAGAGAVRRVRNRGHIKWQGRLRFVGRAFVGERIGLKDMQGGGCEVYLGTLQIGEMHDGDIMGMRPVTAYREREKKRTCPPPTATDLAATACRLATLASPPSQPDRRSLPNQDCYPNLGR